MQRSYLIVYDIRRLDSKTRQMVSRRLRGICALRLQHSVGESNEIGQLKKLAGSIEAAGGKVFVLEKKIVQLSHV